MDLGSFTPDQQKAITHLDGPLLVCAGAGTGKTFTLTQRITWALTGDPENGIPPFLDSIDDALVITYTNKAAAELKGRFRSALRAAGKFEDALKVDGAWISTIHGMCSRILREHALEVGIDPEFELAIGADSTAALDQAIDSSIHDPHDSRHFQPLFDEYGTAETSNMVRLAVQQASYQTRGFDAFDVGPGRTDISALLRETIGYAEELAATGKKTNKATAKADVAAQELAKFQMDSGSEEELADLLSGLGLTSLTGAAASDLKASARTLTDALSLNRAWNLQQLLLEMARKVEAAYRAILQENSQVDTGDLIRMTLQVFDEHPEIARQYTDRFKLIMVDEFQDTSQLQIDMIERIAGSDRRHLCTVGDSQQSIYRFQGADVGVYLKHKRDMKDSGALLVELQDNFRSNADILAFVRAVCSRRGFFVEDFLDLKAGSTGRRYVGSAPRIELALTLFERGCTDRAIAQEARHIASRFRTLLDEGHRPSEMVILMGASTKMSIYADALREQGMPCMAAGGSKYYDADHVKRCLSLLNVLANPYDSESMLDVLSSEILPVSSDDLLLISTSFDEAAAIPLRQDMAKAFLYRDREPQEQSPLLQHAMQVLHRAWRKLGYVRPSKLFLETVADSGWLDRLAHEGEQGQAKIADVLKMSRLIADAEDQVGYDMSRVARKMQATAQEGEKPGVLSVEGLEAVRLMTIHSSKGLEFPIVAVTNCFTSRADSGALRCTTEYGTVYASLMPKSAKLSADYDLGGPINLALSRNLGEHRAKIAEVNRQREEAERRRLFYVAATRATDALIIAVNKQVTKNLVYKEVEADLLNALFPGNADFPSTSGTFDYGGSEPAVFTRMEVHKEESGPNGAAEEPRDAEGPEDPKAAEASAGSEGGAIASQPGDTPQPLIVPVLPDGPSPQARPIPRRTEFFSYSAIAPHDSAMTAYAATDPDRNGDEAVAARYDIDADKATDFGTALHRTNEWIALQPTLPAESEIHRAALRFGRLYGIRDARRLVAGVDRWFHSKIAARAYSFASCQPEVPFCTEVAGGYLEGEIDLLCTDDGGHAFIVDYKTGGNDAETPDQLFAKHELQASCYAYTTLTSGYHSVELHFVRVERADAQDPSQPQVVSYEFDEQDLPLLLDRIGNAKRAAESAAG